MLRTAPKDSDPDVKCSIYFVPVLKTNKRNIWYNEWDIADAESLLFCLWKGFVFLECGLQINGRNMKL